MGSIFALPSFWTEASQIEWTQLVLFVMFQGAYWSKRAEAAIVVRTGGPFRLWVYMEVQAIVAVRTCEGAGVVRAFGHAPEVVFVQEVAILALLA